MEDNVSIRIRLRDALKFEHDAKRSARAIDNIGDQAAQAARKLARMNAASSKTRVNFGPFSTSMRGGALAVGAFTLAAGKLTPAILGAAEATATLAGGAGAAGGVGLLALAQGVGVAQLGIKGLTDALGGNQTALKALDPEMRGFFDTLHAKQQRLQRTAGSSMLPGLAAGAQSASQNFGVLNRLVGSTGRTLGGLGADAGRMLGSAGFGADLRTVGNANVRIIDNLGHAGLNLADAFRHVAVEASPLAEWLSRMALDGSRAVAVWAKNARTSGQMARFFREARTDLSLLGSAGGHAGRGLINLFGAQDVDGTKTLRSLDQITARFERWSNSRAVRRSVGDAIVAEIPQAVGTVMTAIANNLPGAGATAAKVFYEGFVHADVWGKLISGAFLAKKLGLFKLGKGAAGSFGAKTGSGALAGLASRGSNPLNPIFVSVVNGGLPGTPGPKGGGPGSWLKKLGPFAARNWKTGGLLGGTLAGSALLNHGLGLDQLRDLNPQGTRAWDSAQSILDRLGRGPRTAAQTTDAQARVRAVANQMRGELGQSDIRIDPTAVSIQIAGKEVGRAVIQQAATRRRRR